MKRVPISSSEILQPLLTALFLLPHFPARQTLFRRKDEKSFKAVLLPMAPVYSRQFCRSHVNSSAVTGFLINEPSVNREGCDSYSKQNDVLEEQGISGDGREEKDRFSCPVSPTYVARVTPPTSPWHFSFKDLPRSDDNCRRNCSEGSVIQP